MTVRDTVGRPQGPRGAGLSTSQFQKSQLFFPVCEAYSFYYMQYPVLFL